MGKCRRPNYVEKILFTETQIEREIKKAGA